MQSENISEARDPNGTPGPSNESRREQSAPDERTRATRPERGITEAGTGFDTSRLKAIIEGDSGIATSEPGPFRRRQLGTREFAEEVGHVGLVFPADQFDQPITIRMEYNGSIYEVDVMAIPEPEGEVRITLLAARKAD